MAIHIGTSGWSYDHWEGVLYPHGTKGPGRLDYYVARFATVEVNSSYYHWPRDATFAGWHARLPHGFRMVVKAPRGLTHAKRLFEPEVWLERIARGQHHLRAKRGPLLVQLPPQMEQDQERLAYFLGQVPSWIQVAVEFRHASWHTNETFALLERFGAAYCVMSGAHLPCVLRATAPFVYVRLHGPDPNYLYGGSYSNDDLRWWAERIREWHDGQGRDVWAYFNNDGDGNAVRNADTLNGLLGV
jgi:uncharacterized protein YecE (DUF72 family)